MPHVLRNGLAVVAGVIVGAVVNMAIVQLSPSLVPPPEGIDVTNLESIREGIHLFQPKHFVMPFLAHALGTLAGALIAYMIAASYRVPIAYGIGVFFLCGGIAASSMIPAPTWFIALDLVVAYLPMAWLATQIGGHLTKSGKVARTHEG